MVSHFERFWSIYPRKVAKGQASKAWAKLVNGMSEEEEREFADLLVGAVKSHISNRREMENTKQFVPPWKHPTTWLNGECWNDELKSVYEIRESQNHNTSCCECGKSGPYSDRGWVIREEKTYCTHCWGKKYEDGPTGFKVLRQAYGRRIPQNPGETGHSYISRVFGTRKNRSVGTDKPEVSPDGGVHHYGPKGLPEDDWNHG